MKFVEFIKCCLATETLQKFDFYLLIKDTNYAIK